MNACTGLEAVCKQVIAQISRSHALTVALHSPGHRCEVVFQPYVPRYRCLNQLEQIRHFLHLMD